MSTNTKVAVIDFIRWFFKNKHTSDMPIRRVQVMSSHDLLVDYTYKYHDEYININNIHRVMKRCMDYADELSWVSAVYIGHRYDSTKERLVIYVNRYNIDRRGEVVKNNEERKIVISTGEDYIYRFRTADMFMNSPWARDVLEEETIDVSRVLYFVMQPDDYRSIINAFNNANGVGDCISRRRIMSDCYTALEIYYGEK